MMKKSRNLLITIVVFAAVIVIWWYFGGYTVAVGSGTDKFDSINSLFGGLAFAGMLCTLFMQRQELSMQRDQLKDNSIELVASRKAFEQQVEILKKDTDLNHLLMLKEFNQSWMDGIRSDLNTLGQERLNNPNLPKSEYENYLLERLSELSAHNVKISGKIHRIWTLADKE